MPNIANIFTNNKAGAEMGEDATGNILMPVVEMMADSPHELLGRQVQVPKPVACGESGDLSFADMNNNVEQVSDGYTGMQHRFSGAMASNDEQIRNFDPLLRNHRPDLSHTFEDDVWGGDYSDTNLCRWCGPPGHTAIDCVKWDPEHFDKAVCVAGNNKKQGLSDCTTKWPNMSEQERRTLLLERGAGKPGARSDFYPWVSVSSFHFSLNLPKALLPESVLG